MEIVHKPWGYYTVLDRSSYPNNDIWTYKVKRLSVAPGGRLSLQSHASRDEHWVVVSGYPTVTIDNDITVLSENGYVFIPAGKKHRLENFTDGWIHIIETQYGSYLGEDDIVRYDDIYNRIPEYTGKSER